MKNPTHYHDFFMKKTINLSLNEEGWKIMGRWGNEEAGEVTQIGPTFKDSEYDSCLSLLNNLKSYFNLPYVLIDDVEDYMTFINEIEPESESEMNNTKVYCDDNNSKLKYSLNELIKIFKDQNSHTINELINQYFEENLVERFNSNDETDVKEYIRDFVINYLFTFNNKV